MCKPRKQEKFCGRRVITSRVMLDSATMCSVNGCLRHWQVVQVPGWTEYWNIAIVNAWLHWAGLFRSSAGILPVSMHSWLVGVVLPVTARWASRCQVHLQFQTAMSRYSIGKPRSVPPGPPAVSNCHEQVRHRQAPQCAWDLSVGWLCQQDLVDQYLLLRCFVLYWCGCCVLITSQPEWSGDEGRGTAAWCDKDVQSWRLGDAGGRHSCQPSNMSTSESSASQVSFVWLST